MQLHIGVYLKFKLDGPDDLEWFEFVGYVKKLDDQPKTPGYKKRHLFTITGDCSCFLATLALSLKTKLRANCQDDN